uniref:RSAM-associated Gly-rich repeat protein n=1 Tax=Cyanothece sp. (strain PCC 7425 / ATCC 29141) TaxID=395961 RepID=B8HV48_CYAP4
MKISTYTGLLGFLLALSALNISAASATPQRNASSSIEGRLNRITAAIRQREAQLDSELPGNDLMLALGFADGSRGGSFNQGARFGTASGPGGGTFNNAHPAYGGYGGAAGWRDAGGSAGFANGAYGGGGFANGAYGGAGFANGAYGGAGFANGAYGGAGFRNW